MPTIKDYLSLETAKKYTKTSSDALSQIDQKFLHESLAKLEEDGYVIVPDVLSEEVLDEIKAAVEPLLNDTGRNFFEGEKLSEYIRLSRRYMLVMA